MDDFDGNGRLDVISSLFGHRGPSAPPEPLVVSWWEADGFHTDNIDGIELAWAPTLADLDDDGDLDVITAGSQEWLRNDDSLFTPVYWEGITEARILYVREFEPYDLNQDGHLDLFGLSTNQDADPELGNEVFFWGLGSGEYAEVNDVIPALDIPGSGFDSFWIDWFGDGQAEVFVANDRGALHAPNSLLQLVNKTSMLIFFSSKLLIERTSRLPGLIHHPERSVQAARAASAGLPMRVHSQQVQ